MKMTYKPDRKISLLSRRRKWNNLYACSVTPYGQGHSFCATSQITQFADLFNKVNAIFENIICKS